MCGHREILGADIFSEGEKRVVAAQILDGRFDPLIDLDLLDARIAFDVENAIAREQIVVEFLRAADVQDRVGFAVEFANSFERKAGGRIAGQIAGAETPAAFEIELGRRDRSSNRAA